MITIQLNGHERELESTLTLQTLFDQLKVPLQFRAVVQNEQVVPRSEIPKREIQEGDRIEILQACGGG